ENARKATKFFEKAGISGFIEYRVGDALSLLDQEAGPFDIILNDIDKHQYPEAFKRAVPKLRKGGLLITDNTLWHGRVVSAHSEPSTQGVLRFNKLSYQYTDLLTR